MSRFWKQSACSRADRRGLDAGLPLCHFCAGGPYCRRGNALFTHVSIRTQSERTLGRWEEGEGGSDLSGVVQAALISMTLSPYLKRRNQPLIQGRRDPSPQSFKLSPLEGPIQTTI